MADFGRGLCLHSKWTTHERWCDGVLFVLKGCWLPVTWRRVSRRCCWLVTTLVTTRHQWRPSLYSPHRVRVCSLCTPWSIQRG